MRILSRCIRSTSLVAAFALLLAIPANAGIFGTVQTTRTMIGISSGASVNTVESTLVAAGAPDRAFGLHDHFLGWSNLPSPLGGCPTSCGDATITDDYNHHRIPVIRWKCGDNTSAPTVTLNNEAGSPGNSIANGDYDTAVIVPTAQAFAAAKPQVFFLTFMWEFDNNLHFAGQPPNQQSPVCFTYNDTVSGHLTIDYGDFCAAWDHIHSVFVANGATNVKFVENYDGKSANVTAYNLPAMFCGTANVDLIGADIYDKYPADGVSPGFINHYSPFYTALNISPENTLPFIIPESGEQQYNIAPAETQCQFLNEVETSVATTFPLLQYYNYFDSSGSAPNNWILNSQGFACLATLATDPRFTMSTCTTGGSC